MFYIVYRNTPEGKLYMSFGVHEPEGWEFWAWTPDIKDALKFYDRESAEQVSAECEDCMIGEHDGNLGTQKR